MTGTIPSSIERAKSNSPRLIIEERVKEMHPFGSLGYYVIAKPGIALEYLLNPKKEVKD